MTEATYNRRKKRQLITTIFMGLGIVVAMIILAVWSVYASPRLQSPFISVGGKVTKLYRVEKGDTVAGIAKRYLGDWRKWRYLAQINDLKILPKNIIIIKPGQLLRLSRVELTEDEKLGASKAAVWDRMVYTFYWRTRKKGYPRSPAQDWALEPLKMIDSSTDRMAMKMIFSETVHRIEWRDVIRIYETMVEITDTPGELIRLAAMSWSESDNTNVRGQAGEIGNMQIQPGTALDILKSMDMDVKTLDLQDVEALLADVRVNTRLGSRHIQNLTKRYNGNAYMALRRYNGNIHMRETKVYADKITARMQVIRLDYEAKLAMLYKEKENQETNLFEERLLR